MNAKKIVVTSVAGVMLGGVLLTAGKQIVSGSLVSRIDDYVVIKNNQYVLELTDNVKAQFTLDEITQAENDLNYYNQRHLRNQIYMDVNWSFLYSFHILK